MSHLPFPNFTRAFTIAMVGAAAFGTSLTQAMVPLVVIDPGHGGKDGGAYHGGVKEKTVNLQLAIALEYHLHNLGIDTALTRDRDIFIELADRARYAGKFTGPKIFVSLHYNAHERAGAKGIETLYRSPKSRSLAQYIQSALVQQTRATDRGIKVRTDLRVLRSNSAPVSVLVEGGFLSNPQERLRIADPRYRDLQAAVIASAIAHYMGRSTRPVSRWASASGGTSAMPMQITTMATRQRPAAVRQRLSYKRLLAR